MNDLTAYLFNMSTLFQGSSEERAVSDLILNDNVSLNFGDKRLNYIAALTFNSVQSDKIFRMLEQCINPREFPWKTLHKTLLVVKTIVVFGSEYAVDSCLNFHKEGYIKRLVDYNSVISSSSFFYSAGIDYGAPVREVARELMDILSTDENIREARKKSRGSDDILIPMGYEAEESRAAFTESDMMFGQGVAQSVGARHGLENIPGMYEGRPERYFDSDNDMRKTAPTGDHQFTREAFAPPLIDLLDTQSNDEEYTSNLPDAQFLPALEKQKQLEKQLAEQQAQLQRLMAAYAAPQAQSGVQGHELISNTYHGHNYAMNAGGLMSSNGMHTSATDIMLNMGIPGGHVVGNNPSGMTVNNTSGGLGVSGCTTKAGGNMMMSSSSSQGGAMGYSPTMNSSVRTSSGMSSGNTQNINNIACNNGTQGMSSGGKHSMGLSSGGGNSMGGMGMSGGNQHMGSGSNQPMGGMGMAGGNQHMGSGSNQPMGGMGMAGGNQHMGSGSNQPMGGMGMACGNQHMNMPGVGNCQYMGGNG